MAPEAADAVRDAVALGLRAFNQAHAGAAQRNPLVLAASDTDSAVVGGLVGETAWQWLFVDHLWVDESRRRRGIGHELLRRAEEEAVNRGCIGAYLDTFDFQARPFYEGVGYTLFGTLDGYPPGHSRFFLRKQFASLERPANER